MTVQSVTLSRRNLLTLLSMLELDGHKTLTKPGPLGPTLVSVLSDEEAYRNREAGPMSPWREMFIRLMEDALKVVRRRMQRDSNPPPWALEAARRMRAAEGCAGCEEPCGLIAADAQVIADCYRAEYGL